MSNSPESKPRLSFDSAAPGGRALNQTSDAGHIGSYVRVLHKRRWTVVVAFFVIVVSTAVYTFTAPSIYEAKTTMLIESDSPNIVSFKEVVEEGRMRGDYYQTQYNMLQSRSLARKTIDELKLWDQGRASAGNSSTRRAVIDWARQAAKAVRGVFTDGPREPPAPDETRAQSAAIDSFLGSLRVVPVASSRLVALQFRSSDPALAPQVVNTLARLFIEQNLEFKFLASKEASDWLGARLAEQRKKVEDSESALQRYREQNDAVSLEERQNIVVQKLGDLNGAVTRAKTQRIEKESLYEQLRVVQNDRAALDTYPAILSNSFIQQLKGEVASLQRQLAQLSQTLGEKHPRITELQTALDSTDARLRGEIGKVVQGVRNEFLAAQSQERSLTEALEAQKREALGLNRKGIDYGVLQRDSESNRSMYQSLMQRTKEAGVSGELKTNNIRIVDAAEVPRNAVTPNRRLNMIIAVFGGALFAIGMAFFFEYLDNRIKTPEEIKVHLNLPFLGMIPAVPANQLHGEAPMLNNGVPPGFAEAFRAVRTNLLFSSAQEGSRSIVITSSGPNEGKTVVACNLAAALAQSGQRVLIIDADLRRPKVHAAFGQPSEPGLSNLLVGTAKASDVVAKTTVPGLWVLPSGRLPPNPAELLGSARFRDFLATLGQHFDWIIIDTPPIMAVTDAAPVAHLASGVLFVVGAEMTPRAVAQHALEQLEAAQGHLIGAVLNRVDLERDAYYYSQYYRREYRSYYVGA
jgi:succinoglycan biosynthesis transport protein ExoP